MASVAVASFTDGLVEELLGGFLDEIIAESKSMSHHTGVSKIADARYYTDIILKTEGKPTLVPGFDMKWEKRPVGPNGEERGGLLTGSGVRYNKKGQRYNIIPINPDHEPSGFNLPNEDKTLFVTANMLAEKKGIQAAEAFLRGVGGGEDMVYAWKTERYKGMVQQNGGNVVFRTVTEDPSQKAAWWYPPRMTEEVSSDTIDALLELETLLGGG